MDILNAQEQAVPFHTINVTDDGIGAAGGDGGFPTFGGDQTPGLTAMLDRMGRTIRARVRSGAFSPDQAAAMDADPGNLVAAYQTIRTQHGYDDARASKLLSSSIRAFGTAANATETAPLIDSIAKARNDDPFLVARRLEQERAAFQPLFLTPDKKGDPVAEDDANTMFMSAVRGIGDYEGKYGIVMPADVEAKILSGVATRAAEARRLGLTGIDGSRFVETSARSFGYLNGGVDDDPVSKFASFRDRNHNATVFGSAIDRMLEATPEARSYGPKDTSTKPLDFLVTELLAGVLDKAGVRNLNAGRDVGDLDAAHDDIVSGFADALRSCCSVGTDQFSDRACRRVAEDLFKQRKETGTFDFSSAFSHVSDDPSRALVEREKISAKFEKARQDAIAGNSTATDTLFPVLSAAGYFSGTPMSIAGAVNPVMARAAEIFKQSGDSDDIVALKTRMLADAQSRDMSAYRNAAADKDASRQTNMIRQKTKLAAAFQAIDFANAAARYGIITRDAANSLISRVYDPTRAARGEDPIGISVMAPVDQSWWRSDATKFGSAGNFAYRATPGAHRVAELTDQALLGLLPGTDFERRFQARNDDPFEQIVNAITEAGGDPDRLSGGAANLVKAARLAKNAMSNYRSFVESSRKDGWQSLGDNWHFWKSLVPWSYGNSPEHLVEDSMSEKSMSGLSRSEREAWNNYHASLAAFKEVTGADCASLLPSGLGDDTKMSLMFSRGPTPEEQRQAEAKELLANLSIKRADLDPREAAALNRMFLSYANRSPGMRRFVERSMSGVLQSMIPEWKPGSGAADATLARLVKLYEDSQQDTYTNQRLDSPFVMATPQGLVNDASLLARNPVVAPHKRPDGSFDEEQADVSFVPVDTTSREGFDRSVADSLVASFAARRRMAQQKMRDEILGAAERAKQVAVAKEEAGG